MTNQTTTARAARLDLALGASTSSSRLQAALTAGSTPDPSYLPILIARCATEPDFYVRDMLTWAITRHDRTEAVDFLLRELDSPIPQARSQALHSLSKIGDERAWPALTLDLLRDENTDVARAAWRTAVGLAPEHERAALAHELAHNFGRGDREVQRSLSRALAMLGHAAESVVARAGESRDLDVRAHALATTHMIKNPDASFESAVEEARRIVAVRAAPIDAVDAIHREVGRAGLEPATDGL